MNAPDRNSKNGQGKTSGPVTPESTASVTAQQGSAPPPTNKGPVLAKLGAARETEAATQPVTHAPRNPKIVQDFLDSLMPADARQPAAGEKPAEMTEPTGTPTKAQWQQMRETDQLLAEAKKACSDDETSALGAHGTKSVPIRRNTLGSLLSRCATPLFLLLFLGGCGGYFWLTRHIATRKEEARHLREVQRMIERSNRLERLAATFGARISTVALDDSSRHYKTTAELQDEIMSADGRPVLLSAHYIDVVKSEGRNVLICEVQSGGNQVRLELVAEVSVLESLRGAPEDFWTALVVVRISGFEILPMPIEDAAVRGNGECLALAVEPW